MELSTSECSSGCESGWTTYFDQYSDSADQCNRRFSRNGDEDFRSKGAYTTDIDDDLSMVSDASSGPPHYVSCCTSSPSERRKRNPEKKAKEYYNPCLDDTASSPGISFSKHLPGFSQGLCATDPKGKSTLKKQFGFSRPSVKGKAASGRSGDSSLPDVIYVGLQGRKK